MTSVPVLILLAVCALCMAWSGFAAYTLLTSRKSLSSLRALLDMETRARQRLEIDLDFLKKSQMGKTRQTRVAPAFNEAKAAPGMRLDRPNEPYTIREEAFVT